MQLTPTLQTPGLADRVAPLLAADVLQLTDVHVVDRLAVLAGETRLDVLLALACAVRAPGLGHTGLPLAAPQRLVLAATDAEATPVTFDWPTDADAWRTDLITSPLVASAAQQGFRPFVLEGQLLQTARLAGYEGRLAQALVARAAAPKALAYDVPRLQRDLQALFAPRQLPVGAELPPLRVTRQVLAATLAVTGSTTCISGGPGTGKTTTVRQVLVALYEQAGALGQPAPRVALAAPTGKAAARMQESLTRERPAHGISDAAWAWLTDLQPKTLHRLLGWQPRTPSRFRHHRDNPLPHDVVVVDEASMIDVALMCKLVEAVAEDARLVLLGDRNQLVSVEAGSAFADLTAGAGAQGLRLTPTVARRVDAVLGTGTCDGWLDLAATPLASAMVHFTEAFRFETEALRVPIYALADASSAAGAPEELVHLVKARHALCHSHSPEVRHVVHPEGGRGLDADLLAEVVDTYARLLAPLRQGKDEAKRQEALAGVDGLRVLTAHRSGPLGVAGLNRAIGEGLQARWKTPASQRSSGWWVGRMVLVTHNDYEHGLWNGDIGVVVRDDDRPVVVFAPSEAGGALRVVAAASMPAHETAFAMTVHKAQGSQFDHAVLVLPSVASRLLTRELVYTGISRAKKRLTWCGDPEVLATALAARVTRTTSLEHRLWRG
jgi:exodeoxyribonuclease V alpha subunit